jgi:hypothetical protein
MPKFYHQDKGRLLNGQRPAPSRVSNDLTNYYKRTMRRRDAQ